MIDNVLLDKFLHKANAKIMKYLLEEGFSPEEAKSIYNINVEYDEEAECTDVYVYVDISLEGCLALADRLNPTLEFISKEAYFEIEQPGILVANIYDEQLNEVSYPPLYDLSYSDKIKFGNLVTDEVSEIYQEEFWFEDIEIDDEQIFMSIYSDNATSEASIPYKYPVTSYKEFIEMYLDNMIQALLDNVVEEY